MAGHSGVHWMIYQVISPFWWPYVPRDTTDGVLGSGKSQLPQSPDAPTCIYMQQTVLHDLPSHLDTWPGSSNVPEKKS
jgi:hypothetical protein